LSDLPYEVSGLQPTLEVIARAILVFGVTLVSLRLASKRFLGRYSAFDWVLSIILGSVLSRAINGSAPLLPTLAVAPVFIGLHWLLGAIAVRSPTFNRILQGQPTVLVRQGSVCKDAARKAHITDSDLLEELRYQIHVDSLQNIDTGILECNGRISVVRAIPGDLGSGDSP
jgi:uncharacterized membrane protein YcaP (DUF421 family)